MFENDDNESWKPDLSKPLFKKANEILDVVIALVDVIPDDGGIVESSKQFMLEDAMIIPAKIKGAEAGALYDIKMENAAIIRRCARSVMIRCNGLNAKENNIEDYIKMLRDLIEEFRLLFIDWVASFDKWDYIVDRWGLFNPPGIGPHDEQED